MSVLRDIGSAIRLLTVLPTRGADGDHPVRWFPLVGWVFGVVGAGIAYAADWFGVATGDAEALVVGGLVVAAWALLSGMLHWDGLADAADGLGVRGDTARRLEVMRGSATGAYGVTAVVLVALLQVSAIAALVGGDGVWAIVAAPVIARCSAGVALISRNPARADGLAARYAGSERAVGLLVMALVLAPVVLVAPNWRCVVLGVACLLVSFAFPTPFARRFGGVTGDVLGATVLLTETVVLVGAVIARVPA